MFDIFLAGNYFTYNNVDSEWFNLRLVIVDTVGIESMGGKLDYKKNKANGLYSDTIQRTDYNTPLSFDIEMWADEVLTDERIREIFYHYFESRDFHKLRINDEMWAGLYFDCTINDIVKIIGGVDNDSGVIGFKATVACSAPWALEDEKSKVYASVSNTGMRFDNISDCKDYMYPILRIKTSSDCTGFSITNNSDSNRQLVFSELVSGDLKNQTITINPLTGEVFSGYGSKYANFNKRFFRLAPGVNIFGVAATPANSVTELEIIYQNVRVVT